MGGPRRRFVDRLVALTEVELTSARGGRPLSGASRLLLREALETSRRVSSRLLATEADEAALRHAIEGFWAYQLAGLRALVAWAVDDDGPRRPPRPGPGGRPAGAGPGGVAEGRRPGRS